MPIVARTILLLTLSNVFMTFAWYAHLRNLSDRVWYLAALASWGIALFEYLLQVPANRMGYTVLSLGQLKELALLRDRAPGEDQSVELPREDETAGERNPASTRARASKLQRAISSSRACSSAKSLS